MNYCTTTTSDTKIIYPCFQTAAKKKYINHLKIVQTVMNYFKLDKQKVFTTCRKREEKDCRFFIMYFLRKNTQLTLKDVGGLFPGKTGKGLHYSSVIHAVKTINDLLKNNEEIRRHYYNLLNMIEG